MDACERLSQLNLTEVQQREIVRVALHCLGNVSTFFLRSAAWGHHSIYLGETVQSVLYPRRTTALQNVSLVQGDTTVLPLGFPPGSWREERRGCGDYQEPEG